MTDSGCIFCEILAGLSPGSFVLRDGSVSAFMDIQPINPGHLLVVPNAHAAHLADLPGPDGMAMFLAAQRRSGLRCEGVDLILADGAAAGQDVFHAHLHVIPRYAGDGFGFRFGPGYADLPERSELDVAGARILAALEAVD
jgi:histidine triad (HIT) family protein